MCKNVVQRGFDHLTDVFLYATSDLIMCFRCDHITDLISVTDVILVEDKKHNQLDSNISEKRRNKCDKEWINTNDDEGIYQSADALERDWLW